jgi:protein arginine kinase activator
VLCQLCGKKPAVIHFSEIDQGEVRHLHLCADCAQTKEASSPGEAADVKKEPTAKPLLQLLQKLLASESEDVNIQCAQCGHTYADFRSSGRLGCGHCYEAFSENLEPLLKRVHGSSRHTGKVPECMDDRVRTLRERNRLKQELAAAVEREAFEEAASLRDKIKAIESAVPERSGEENGTP